MFLHPFFSYFGSKCRLAKYYPSPQCDEIIEPFAGSAGYSLMYPDRQVSLYEINDSLVELWDYLIHVSESEILSLSLGPFDKYHPIESEIGCVPARALVGFWTTEGQTSASRYPLSKSRGGNWSARKRQMIASQLDRIRHWKIDKCSFDQIPDRAATWFVDPPYQEAGGRYKHSRIDYAELARWCQSRSGQTIACEQNNADWLEFDHLATQWNSCNQHYKEIVWTHSTCSKTEEHKPQSLFSMER